MTNDAQRIPRGFTLLELAVVVTILGVLLVVALPSMRGLQSLNRLATAASDVAAVLRYARGRAVFGERGVVVWLDVRDGWFKLDLQMTDQDLLTRHRRGERLRFPEERVRRLPNEIEFSDVFVWSEQVDEQGRVMVEFFPNGSATPALLVLKNRKTGRQMTLEVGRSTGRVTLTEGKPEKPGLAGQTSIVREKVVVVE